MSSSHSFTAPTIAQRLVCDGQQVALCRKHGVKPYRYPRQPRNKVMVRVRQTAFEQAIGAEFREFHRELTSCIREMVNHLIAYVMKSDGADETLEQRRIKHLMCQSALNRAPRVNAD